MTKRYKNKDKSLTEVITKFDKDVCSKCIYNNDCFRKKKIPKRNIYSNVIETVISCNYYKEIE